MKIKPSTLVNMILSAILLTSIFLVGSTTSQGQYDPWVDINDE